MHEVWERASHRATERGFRNVSDFRKSETCPDRACRESGSQPHSSADLSENPAVGTIRDDWHFDVVTALQRATTRLALNPLAVSEVLRDLSDALPAPAVTAEIIVLHDRLHAFVCTAADRIHRDFHRVFAVRTCEGAVVEAAEHIWRLAPPPPEDPRRFLPAWGQRFAATFRRTHRVPAEYAALLTIVERYREPLPLETLARSAGMSRASLCRSFETTFGALPSDCQREFRLRDALTLLRETDVCVDAVARTVGYASTKNLYAALRHRTTRSPGQIRRERDDPPEDRATDLEGCPSKACTGRCRPFLKGFQRGTNSGSQC